MSAGLPSYSLSVAAAYVLRSLMEHPHRQTPDEIAQEIDAENAREGLDELKSRGLADEDADGRWTLTEAGRKVSL